MALVEAVLLGLVLMVPLVWLLGVLDHVHRAALGATTAAREAGFAVASATDPQRARDSMQRAIALALDDHSLDVERARVHLSLPDGGERGSVASVEVRYPVPVIDVPAFGGLPSVWVTARHVATVDPYRSR
jgi:hypothetical protein